MFVWVQRLLGTKPHPGSPETAQPPRETAILPADSATGGAARTAAPGLTREVSGSNHGGGRRGVSGHVLLAVGLGGIVAGIALTIVAGPTLRRYAVSPYPISPVAPQPVLEPWVEGRITVDARSYGQWVYFDFSRGSVVTDARIDGHNWDLAFQRYHVATNSGSTHPSGAAGAIRLGELGSDPADHPPREAPLEGYEVDEWEGDISYNHVFRRWYRYNPMAQGLVSRGHYYIVRTADAGHAWLQFLGYQCPAELSGGHGCVTFRYGYRSDFSRTLAP